MAYPIRLMILDSLEVMFFFVLKFLIIPNVFFYDL